MGYSRLTTRFSSTSHLLIWTVQPPRGGECVGQWQSSFKEGPDCNRLRKVRRPHGPPEVRAYGWRRNRSRPIGRGCCGRASSRQPSASVCEQQGEAAESADEGWDAARRLGRNPPSHGRVRSQLHLQPAMTRRISSESPDRKSTRLNSSHRTISYAVFCLKKKKEKYRAAGDPLDGGNHLPYRAALAGAEVHRAVLAPRAQIAEHAYVSGAQIGDIDVFTDR